MVENSPEQRARDGQLAWAIVLASGAVTLALVAALLVFGWHHVTRWARDQALEHERAANPIRPPVALTPADTATPSEDWRSWINTRNRPTRALARGEHGGVRVTLAIDAMGKPTGCSVTESSGFWGLDNGTCLALMGEGRFNRARSGEPGGGEGEVRRWTSPVIYWNDGRSR